MKTRRLSLLSLVFCFAVSYTSAQEEIRFGIPPAPPNPGKLMIVKSTGDTVDAKPGDGVCADASGDCTLRAAVDEMNANNGPADVIIFEMAYPAVIELTLGELNLSDAAATIIGPGARRLTIRRGATAAPFRIFNVTNTEPRSQTRIWRLRLEGGDVRPQNGGAVRIAAGANVDLREMWFASNRGDEGGAIANEGTLNVTRSLFQLNIAGDGGAIHLASGSSMVLTNSTLTSNHAVQGGAINAEGTLVSANNTLTYNSAVSYASSIANDNGGSVSLLNTIVGQDYPPQSGYSLRGPFISLGNNIVVDDRQSNGFTDGVNGDQIGIQFDPMLGKLADNGGQTDTFSLLEGSPAIDRGNSCVYSGQCSLAFERLRWDQRTNHIRMALSGGSIVDVGAFESGSMVSTASVTVGAFSPSLAPRNIGFVFAIDVTTSERRTAIVHMRGGYRFSNLRGGEVYVFDHHIKNRAQGPFVSAFLF